MTAILSAIIALLMVISAALVILSHKFAKAARETKAVYDGFVEFARPADDGGASQLALLVTGLSDNMSKQVVDYAKANLLSMEGVEARRTKAIEGDIALDELAKANPIAGALLSQYPTLRKTIKRNPQLANMALDKLITRFTQPQGAVESKSKWNGTLE